MRKARGDEKETEEKETECGGHKIMKRQKAMTVCTFKPNGLIKGPCQSTTFGLMFKYSTQPQKHQYSS